ncbi:GH12 family glycosyl hydrolase domain-containing protein [Streptacidiphilus cavernicola]|uniref:Glycoside hydrolase n=1 Tax=Streptacidiphilus cavernicola TaxID=3342716 RepID=A0ABV6VNS5_9ACTN
MVRRWVLVALPVLLTAGVAVAAVLQQGFGGGPATRGPVSLCTRPGQRFPVASVGNGSYQLNPDEWNSQAALCMSGDGGADFTVTSSGLSAGADSSAGAPGAYPRIAYQPGAGELPVPVASLGDALTSWSTTVVPTGRYDVAYDVWLARDATGCAAKVPPYELMVWVNQRGGPVPLGGRLGGSGSTVTLNGKAYLVYGHRPTSRTSPTDHQVITYQRAVTTTSVHDLHLRRFIADAVDRGYIPAAGYLCSVQAGFEIWNGGAGLSTDSFSFRLPGARLPPWPGRGQGGSRGRRQARGGSGAVGGGA